jgi:hypothetical protein
VDDEDIRSTGLVQVNDGIYAEVPLRCASGPIARRRINLVCLEASVPRPYRSDVYGCSKSF